MKPSNLRISINNLPLIRQDAVNLVKLHKDLQKKIKNQQQINLTERLQETHHKIKARISQLEALQEEHFSDPRGRFIEIIKLQLSKAISPADQLNMIVDTGAEFKTQKLTIPSFETTSNRTIAINKEEITLDQSRKKPSPLKSSKTPLKHQNTSRTPIKPAAKVPALNMKDIPKKSPSRHTQNQLEAKLKKFSEQEKVKTKSPARIYTEQKSSSRQPTKKEVSDKMRELENKRKNIDSLQQLRLTIKMTKEEYLKFMKGVEMTEI